MVAPLVRQAVAPPRRQLTQTGTKAEAADACAAYPPVNAPLSQWKRSAPPPAFGR